MTNPISSNLIGWGADFIHLNEDKSERSRQFLEISDEGLLYHKDHPTAKFRVDFIRIPGLPEDILTNSKFAAVRGEVLQRIADYFEFSGVVLDGDYDTVTGYEDRIVVKKGESETPFVVTNETNFSSLAATLPDGLKGEWSTHLEEYSSRGQFDRIRQVVQRVLPSVSANEADLAPSRATVQLKKKESAQRATPQPSPAKKSRSKRRTADSKNPNKAFAKVAGRQLKKEAPEAFATFGILQKEQNEHLETLLSVENLEETQNASISITVTLGHPAFDNVLEETKERWKALLLSENHQAQCRHYIAILTACYHDFADAGERTDG